MLLDRATFRVLDGRRREWRQGEFGSIPPVPYFDAVG
jgi:hypothetical protein